MKYHIFELRRKTWRHDWSPQLKKKNDISNIHSFVFFTFFGYITNSQCNQLPVDLIAQLVKHCTGIAEANCDDQSRESLINCLQTLDNFYKVPGLKLNDKKTEALGIGSKWRSSEISLPRRNFKWPKNKVKALGVWLSIDAKETAAMNYWMKN